MINGFNPFANMNSFMRNPAGHFGNFKVFDRPQAGASAPCCKSKADDTTEVPSIDEVPEVEEVEEVATEEETVESEVDKKETALADIFDKFGLTMPDELNVGDYTGMQYVKAQFGINYSVMQSISTANGTQTRSFEFSFSGSMEMLRLGNGDFASDPFSWLNNMPGLDGIASEAGETGEASNDPMQMMKDFFSPESTASRILDFALGGFGNSSYAAGGDTQEARSGFANFIGEAIQKGFDEAMGILGKVDDSIQSDIDKTHDIVFNGLDDFASGDADTESPDNSELLAQYQQYSFEYSSSYSYSRMWYNNSAGSDAAAPQDSQSAVDSVA